MTAENKCFLCGGDVVKDDGLIEMANFQEDELCDDCQSDFDESDLEDQLDMLFNTGADEKNNVLQFRQKEEN